MSCDIHAFAEVKLRGSKAWQFFGERRLPQDYRLFAKIAGVRNEGEWELQPIAPERGLPRDVSPMTRFLRDRRGEDGHSDSWLTSTEVDTVVKWYNELVIARLRESHPKHKPCCQRSAELEADLVRMDLALEKNDDSSLEEMANRRYRESLLKDLHDWYSLEHAGLGYIFGNGWDFQKYPNDYPPELQDVRLVVWFDG